ncbi:MAG: acyl carrier protein [Verrucomicrobia bacterium]|nr:MAG: acyl carrier protein [Verrucomicrobiota bacterium]
MDSTKEVSIDLLKGLLVENTMIKVDPETINEETILFGEEGIGLDSLDALQMIVAVEKRYGIEIKDPTMARDALQSLGVLRDWIQTRLTSTSVS